MKITPSPLVSCTREQLPLASWHADFGLNFQFIFTASIAF
jgi:hypothetical protein